MTERSEDAVIADIDALISESLARGPRDDYHRDHLSRIDGRGDIHPERCELCLQEFHGLPSDYSGCPGAYGTPEEVEAWSQGIVLRSARPGAPWILPDELRASPEWGLRPGVIFGGREPLWLRQMQEHTERYARETVEPLWQMNPNQDGAAVQHGYSLSDIEAMRGGFGMRAFRNGVQAEFLANLAPLIARLAEDVVPAFAEMGQQLANLGQQFDGWAEAMPPPPYAYQEQFGPPQVHRPRVRFWGMGPEGRMRMIEGTLEFVGVEENPHTLTLHGRLLPPVVQQVLDDANLSVEYHRWLPGDEEPVDISGAVTPVGTFIDGVLSSVLEDEGVTVEAPLWADLPNANPRYQQFEEVLDQSGAVGPDGTMLADVEAESYTVGTFTEPINEDAAEQPRPVVPIRPGTINVELIPIYRDLAAEGWVPVGSISEDALTIETNIEVEEMHMHGDDRVMRTWGQERTDITIRVDP